VLVLPDWLAEALIASARRSTVNRTVVALPVVCFALVALAACAKAVEPSARASAPGVTVAATDEDDASAASAGVQPDPSNRSEPTAGGGSTSVADLDPCTLINATALSQYGLRQTRSAQQGDVRACEWQHSAETFKETYTFSVTIRSDAGLDDISAARHQVSSLDIGTRHARESRSTDVGITLCTVFIEADKSVRLDIEADNVASTAESCVLAERYAKVVEARLPPGK
jgi:Protein of unknown function (DUF3558)